MFRQCRHTHQRLLFSPIHQRLSWKHIRRQRRLTQRKLKRQAAHPVQSRKATERVCKLAQALHILPARHILRHRRHILSQRRHILPVPHILSLQAVRLAQSRKAMEPVCKAAQALHLRRLPALHILHRRRHTLPAPHILSLQTVHLEQRLNLTEPVCKAAQDLHLRRLPVLHILRRRRHILRQRSHILPVTHTLRLQTARLAQRLSLTERVCRADQALTLGPLLTFTQVMRRQGITLARLTLRQIICRSANKRLNAS